MTKKERDDFYARNAAKGRTVRFSINVDLDHVSEEDRVKHDLAYGGIKIGRGTLSPADARLVLNIIFGDGETGELAALRALRKASEVLDECIDNTPKRKGWVHQMLAAKDAWRVALAACSGRKS